MINKDSLDTVCAALSYAIGIDAPQCAAAPNATLCTYLDKVLCGKKVDRIFMYNPDAIAQWIYEKYALMFTEAKQRVDIEVPIYTVMPSVTPVCFGTMYTGAQPQIHSIRAYVKPVITIDTIFDALIRNGKKPVIVSTTGDSMSKIYLERDMDYFFYDSADKVNQKAEELILKGEHDFIVIYNGNYDSAMHKFGPESDEALAELQANIKAYHNFLKLAKESSKDKNTLVGFAMDHGCHEIDGNCGSHGLNMEEDLYIVHLYKLFKSKN